MSSAPAPVGTTPAQIAALRTWVEQQNRLTTVAAPLLLNNAALCKRNARNVAGFVAKTQYSYSNDFVAAARSGFGLGERLQIMTLFPASGALQSGLEKGDVLLATGDSKFVAGPGAEQEAAKIFESASRGRTAINLIFERRGAPLTVNLLLSRACAFDIEVGDTDAANSYSDGHRILVTRGMLNIVQSDQELAYVLAKEIAHAVLVKTPRPGMRAMIDKLMLLQPGPGTSVRALGLTPYVPVTDATADKLALYMLVQAGFSIDGAPAFWQRVAKQYPAAMASSHTALHPSTSYRLSVIKAVTASIKMKQLNGLPLTP